MSIKDSAAVSSRDYRPDIDGLRALAVLAVMFFHADAGCPGGFVGVDVFFVISGYLISSLILSELANNTFSLITFWERRIRRILPALALVVLVTLAAAYYFYLPEDFKLVGKSVISQAALLSNVFFWRNTGYFAPGSDTLPLLHTWSLAVEEQFYLLFPAFIALLMRNRISVSKTVALLALGSFLLSVGGSYLSPAATFYLLPTRAWELLIGALLATRRGQSANSTCREISGWFGLAFVCFSVFFYNSQTRFPGLAAVPPCLGAALIIFSSESQLSLIGRFLALKPIVFIGLISYSLYLWHWPVLVFSKYLAKGEQSLEDRLLLLTLSIALSVVSWRYVETPFRKRWILQPRRQVFGFAAFSTVALLVLGILISRSSGFPSRFPAVALGYAGGKSHFAFHNEISVNQAVAGHFAELGTGETNRAVDVLLWGDSHAMSVSPVLDDLCRQFSMRGIEATHSATAPVLGYVSKGTYALNADSPVFADAVLSFISQNHVKNVILAAYWSAYPESHAFRPTLPLTVRAIRGLGAKVYVLKDVPVPGFNVPRRAAVTAMHSGNLELLGLPQEKHEMSNRELDSTFKQVVQEGATVLDPANYFLNRKGFYDVVRGGQVLYIDKQHLTIEGSKLLAPLFNPIFCRK